MTGQEARDDEREALIDRMRRASTAIYVATEAAVADDISSMLRQAADLLARKHLEPEITDDQARAVTTVDAIATSTGMSRADVVATVRAIGEPLHGWEYGHQVSLHTGTTIHPVTDEKTARTLAWLHPVYRRHAPGPWVPVGEGEQ